MKKLIVVFALLSLSVAGSALATCPTAPVLHDHEWISWYEYSQDAACYSLTGYISSATVSCPSRAGWSFGGPGLSYAITSFTADGNNMFNPNKWFADAFFYLDSPNTSAYDWVELLAVVTHNGSDTSYVLFYWDGSMGSLNGCVNQHNTVFSAAAGDTVSIKIYAANSGNATIQASYPVIGDSADL